MSDTVIQVENLSKRYILSHQRQERYTTLRDVLTEGAKSLLSPLRPQKRRSDQEEFWALKDVSFEVKQGDRVGIIGRNGAGKSTLLKILSRITEPTSGRVRIRGRVASLLEVGTGFHPELTGRENIFLNGAILGMSKAEINRKFDEIVAFAEVERFLDTPVKRYSSGMYVRLAFAVAAHLEPEILVVDEVLAVGDIQFQKKCLGKMEDVGKEGRTVLFVSHNMAAMRNLCTYGVALDSGNLKYIGEMNMIADKYIAEAEQATAIKSNCKMKYFELEKVEIYSSKGLVIKTFDEIIIDVVFSGIIDLIEPDVYLCISSLEGYKLSGLNLRDFQHLPSITAKTPVKVSFTIDSLPFLPGLYQAAIQLKDNAAKKWEFIPQTFTFEVAESSVYGNRRIDDWFGQVGLRVQTSAYTLPKVKLIQ